MLQAIGRSPPTPAVGVTVNPIWRVPVPACIRCLVPDRDGCNLRAMVATTIMNGIQVLLCLCL
jgi:hypothetical protein